MKMDKEKRGWENSKFRSKLTAFFFLHPSLGTFGAPLLPAPKETVINKEPQFLFKMLPNKTRKKEDADNLMCGWIPDSPPDQYRTDKNKRRLQVENRLTFRLAIWSPT